MPLEPSNTCYAEGVLPFGLSFAAPWVLLALLALPLLPRGRLWPLRLLALALFVVALAQPTLGEPGNRLAVIVDVSDSLGDSAIRAAEALDLSQVRRAPQFYYFAGDTTAVSTLEPPPEFLPTGQTDVARALQVAAADASRLLLISDGGESLGSALLALPDAPVDSLYVPSRENVRLVELLAPERARPGETVEVVAVIESDRATTVTLQPEVGGEALPPIRQQLEPGRTPLSFRFEAQGERAVPVRATLQADFEQPGSDDSQALDIAISEDEPVLVVNDPALAGLLAAQGIQVSTGQPGDISAPLNYSAIILRDTARNYSSGQLELLRSYVEEGGGLLMTGGPESLGFGAWYRTPVEEVLPVNTDLRTEVELPLVALVIVLDRSQSMNTGNPTKLDLAKEGAIGVVDLAYQDDLLGLIVFSDPSATEWAFNLRRATEQGKREMLDAILNVQGQGGTVLEPAYRQAISALEATDAAIKHVIVLSDGKLYDGGGVFGNTGSDVNFNAMAASAQLAGITTSTIAVGEGADFERLESIATSGGGRYYAALDVSTLPRIFTNEALTATRSLLREEAFSPSLHASPLLPEGIGAAPSLNAYIATTAKEEAEVLLGGLQGEPVLAVSRQGLGRSAVLTTDLNRWAGDFGRWDALPGVLGTVVRWLQSRPAEYATTISRDGNEVQVVVDAVRNGEYVNDKRLQLRYAGATVELEQVGPGRYEGRLPLAGDGGNLLVVDGDEVVASSSLSLTASEFDTGDGEALLESVAERSGGTFYRELESYAPTMPDERQPWWPYPALAGLLLFVLELLLRRFAPVRQRQLAASGD